jgi:hypothetical protein
MLNDEGGMMKAKDKSKGRIVFANNGSGGV